MKFLVLLLLGICTFAEAGNETGGGGDPKVVEFYSISVKVCRWGQTEKIKDFPAIENCKEVLSHFRESFKLGQKAKIIFTDEPLKDASGVSKVALFKLSDKSVTVNRQLWELQTRKEKYITAGIELAGLSTVANRYEFGLSLEAEYGQVFGKATYPKFVCKYGHPEANKKIPIVSFNKNEVQDKLDKSIFTAPQPTVVRLRHKHISKIQFSRQYYFGRPAKVIVQIFDLENKLKLVGSFSSRAPQHEINLKENELSLNCERIEF